jgi:hypothetical protein
MKKISFIKLHMAICLMFLALTAVTVNAADILRMSKEELAKAMTTNSIVVVDVRSGRDWKSSEFKIKGAHRVGKDIVKWAAKHPKDTHMALYCA